MNRTIAIAAFLILGPAQAQRLSHDMPPPINIVGAGFNLEGAAKDKNIATWTAGLGLLTTGILYGLEDTRHTAAPWVVGGLTVGVSMSFNLSSGKWMNRAGDLWQCGYNPQTLYEQVADSLGDAPPKRVNVPRLIDGTKIRLPARMRTK